MKLKHFARWLDVDRLLPDAIRSGHAETLRKARIAIYFAMALQVQSTIYIPTFALEGRLTPATFLGLGTLLLCLLPLTLRARQPLFWAGLQIGTLTLVVLSATGYYSGGIHSPSLWWMCIVPVVAMLVSGKRLATLMAVMLIAVVAVFHFLGQAGHTWPTGRDPQSRPEIVFRAIILLMGTLLALAWLFEKAKERTLSALALQNQELRLILDSVGQGFLYCDRSGAVIGRHSSIVESWFGAPAPGASIWSYLGQSDPLLADSFALGWSAIADDFLPLELVIDQLPKRFTAGERCFRVEYKPVMAGDALEKMVVVITDITAIVASERAEAEQRELADSLDCAVRDRAGFRQFIEECDELVGQLSPTNPNLRRVLHTLKGNCGFYGARSVATASHALEDLLAEGCLEPAQLLELQALWHRFQERLAAVLDAHAGTIEVSHEDYTALVGAIQRTASHAELARMVCELQREPVALALGRSASQARALAARMGKGDIEVVVEACNVRLDPRTWRSLWAALVHAIRNAVDHGLEGADERGASGKSPSGRLCLSAEARNEELVISLADDGRGIDWESVRERAREACLPHTTQADLQAALFHSGLSTRTETTDVSGRGIGMGALRQAVLDLGGSIELDSHRGEGTTLRLRFPGGGGALNLTVEPARTAA